MISTLCDRRFVVFVVFSYAHCSACVMVGFFCYRLQAVYLNYVSIKFIQIGWNFPITIPQPTAKQNYHHQFAILNSNLKKTKMTR